MRSLADRIESYLKVLIERSDNDEVEIQRIELAETFRCAPSQITYVLAPGSPWMRVYNRKQAWWARVQKIRKIPAEEKAARPGIAQVQAENIIRELEATGP